MRGKAVNSNRARRPDAGEVYIGGCPEIHENEPGSGGRRAVKVRSVVTSNIAALAPLQDIWLRWMQIKSGSNNYAQVSCVEI